MVVPACHFQKYLGTSPISHSYTSSSPSPVPMLYMYPTEHGNMVLRNKPTPSNPSHLYNQSF